MNASTLHCRLARTLVALCGGVTLVFALGAAASSSPVAGAHAATGVRSAHLGGAWGMAQEVTGATTRKTGLGARINAVSCARPGACAAVGDYTDRDENVHGFVVDERGGAWGKAKEVPGLAALNTGRDAQVQSVSCAGPGACAAVGFYEDRSHRAQGFVADERRGVWTEAKKVPGLAALNTGDAQVQSVSCARTGACAAVGSYTRSHAGQGFVVDERRGVWAKAEKVPGLAALNTSRNGQVQSVSCTRPGHCSAGGYYTDRSGEQGFVVDEQGGVWGKAKEVPGLAPLNTGGDAKVQSVSCARPGHCAAVGYFKNGSDERGFVVDARGGVWGTAEEVPALATLNTGGYAEVGSVSCAGPGDCSAGGYYADRAHALQGFVVDQTHGVWAKADEVHGLVAMNTGGLAGVDSVSCDRPGDCAAAGSYSDGSGEQGFIADETGGVWGTAHGVPGLAALNTNGYAEVNSVSCTRPGHCSAGGYYRDSLDHPQAFVVTEH